MKLKFKDILPNPYRNLAKYPLKPDKIDELVNSINATGFWDNVVVRKNKAGKYELAYGHHRVQACKQAGLTEADFIVKDLSDVLMIQIMDNENREVYASTVASTMESVEAVVQALAAGAIPAFEISPKTRKDAIRYAPRFTPGVPGDAQGDVGKTFPQTAYTTDAMASFLGRTKAREKGRPDKADESITAALNALYLRELGHLTDAMLYQNGSPIKTDAFLRRTNDLLREVQEQQKRRGKTAKWVAKENAKAAEAKHQAEEAEKKFKLAEHAKEKARQEAEKEKYEKEAKRQAEEAQKRRDEEDAAEERIAAWQAKEEKENAEGQRKIEEIKKFKETSVDRRIREVGAIANDFDREKDIALTKSSSLKEREKLGEAWKAAVQRCEARALLYVNSVQEECSYLDGAKILAIAQKNEEAKRLLEQKESQ